MKRGRKSIVEHVMISIGDNIRRNREAQGLSQSQLASSAKIHPMSMSRTELGKCVTLRNIIKICKALDVSFSKITNI